MTDWQRSVLHKLVDRYEKSPAFRGEARVHREFAVKPREIETAYDGFELAVSERFDEEMKALVQQGLVTVKWARAPHQGIVHITARTDAWENIYEALGRKRADVVAGEWLAFFEKAGETEASKAYCAAECARIRSGKKPRQPVERAEKLIMLMDRVVNNDAWLLERELSAECLHDSKALEKYYRETLVNLLIAYSGVSYPLEDMENPEDMREKQRLVLAEHRIMPNPGYLYLKGDCEIRFSGGGNLRLTPQTQVALATESLARMERIAVGASGILSVENLTAYHRLQVPDRLMIYLGGFPQSAMVRLYRRIARENPGCCWEHFGDLDPTGLQILAHLRRSTGLQIAPWHMEVADLERFAAWGRPLEMFDREKIQKLKTMDEWRAVAEWMENHNIKLEQEWMARQLEREGE